jgi:general nucleoside transport system permease protein
VKQSESKFPAVLQDVLSGNPLRAFLAVLMGFFVGAVFMIASSTDFQLALTYFFARPLEAIQVAIETVASGYGGLFRGALFNSSSPELMGQLRPLSETFRFSAPLISAGLGIALAFRAGLFNIGGTGQIVFGMIAALAVSTRFEASAGVHLIIAVVAAIFSAALWGALVGFLKAKTGAHEVILTIMFNYIAIGLFSFTLRTEGLLLQQGGGGTPKSDPPAETASFARVFEGTYELHWGFVLAILAAIVYWWIMEKSTIGYRLRLVGHNPQAAEASGISVRRITIVTMLMSAAFMGLVGANQVLGNQGPVSASAHAGIGFDAITVALLGGSSAPGVVLAGLLFGAFKAGSPAMQAAGVSADVLTIVQASIVLFIAAPPIIRAIFRLPTTSRFRSQDKAIKQSSAKRGEK